MTFSQRDASDVSMAIHDQKNGSLMHMANGLYNRVRIIFSNLMWF